MSNADHEKRIEKLEREVFALRVTFFVCCGLFAAFVVLRAAILMATFWCL